MGFFRRLQQGGFSGALIRWLLAYGAFGVPQAAGPIAFTLLAMPLTGNAGSGAALVLAITLAQIAGSVPFARLGRAFNAVSYLKALVAVRAAAFVTLALLAQMQAPFPVLIAVATCGGLVNGAAFGFLRSILNHLVAPGGMPRALGLAATLNEVTFVVAPILASVLGSAIDPVVALLILVALGTMPVALVPAIPAAAAPKPDLEAMAHGGGLLRPAVILWLACTLANSAVVAAIEIGAVVIGCFLAPLGTFYSLSLDALAPPHRRAEVFALSRTANSLGVILASATLTFASLQVTLVTSAILIFIAAATVAVVSRRTA